MQIFPKCITDCGSGKLKSIQWNRMYWLRGRNVRSYIKEFRNSARIRGIYLVCFQ